MRRLGAERLLPLACAGAAAMLAASQFMTIFELNGAGDQTFQLQTAFEQHHAATIVLAVFALLALVVAVATGSKPAAAAVAIAGIGALLLFLLIDLPDAGKAGTLGDLRGESSLTGQADPAAGFWVELAGALILAICGGALATLSPEQLRSFGPRREEKGPRPAATTERAKSESGKPEPKDERPRKPSRVAGEP
jgi:hypothetical protein